MPTRRVIGTQSGTFLPGFTFSNVVFAEGDIAFAFVSTNSEADDLETIQGFCGATSMSSQGWGFDFGSANPHCSLDVLCSTQQTAGTRNVSITLSNGPSLRVMVCILVVISGLSTEFSVDGTSDHQNTGTSMSMPLSFTTTPEWFEAFLLTVGPSTDTTPTWGGGYTAGARVGATFAGVSITMFEAYKDVTFPGSGVCSASGYTNREWMTGTGGFQYPAPIPPSRTGKLTYDYTFQAGLDKEDISPTTITSREFVPRRVNFERRVRPKL